MNENTVDDLTTKEIDQMASGAQRTRPSVNLGEGIGPLIKDLSPGKLPVFDKVAQVAAAASVLAALSAGYAPEGLNASTSERKVSQTPIETPVTIKTPEIELIKSLTPRPTVTSSFLSASSKTTPDSNNDLEVEKTPSVEPTPTPFTESVNQSVSTTEAKPFDEETKKEVFKIRIRQGESLSSILSFYNMDRQNVEFYNSDEVAVKMTSEEYNNPYKKLCLPTVGMTITSWEEEWNYGEPGYGDFVAYTTLFPYSFFGHTSKDSSGLGTFAGLRETQKGDRFYLSRTWMGEDGDWIEAEVVDIVKVYSTEEEIMVTNRSNSQLLSFTTCFVESGNPDARIIVFAKVVDHKASAPLS